MFLQNYSPVILKIYTYSTYVYYTENNYCKSTIYKLTYNLFLHKYDISHLSIEDIHYTSLKVIIDFKCKHNFFFK